jgi:glycogen(starch) synthase
MPTQPDLRIVLVGSAASHHLSSVFHPLAEFRDRILLLHALPKAQLMGVLSRADAAVLPSLVDNLPNTVIESLELGIPVIGTKGASIDELVEHGRTGLLVAPNDDVALAQAMLDVWNCKAPVTRGFTWDSEIAAEMIPENAVRNFIKYCRSH